MMFTKVAYFVRRLLGKGPEHKILTELTDKTSRMCDVAEVELLNARIAGIVEKRSMMYDDVDAEFEKELKELSDNIDTHLDIEPYLQVVHPDLLDAAKLLAPYYAKCHDNDTLRYFHLVCELHDQLEKAISPFIGWQPITAPVGKIHTLRVMIDSDTKRCSMRILREKVEAHSRRYSARNTLAGTADLASHLAFDIDGEMERALIQELVTETMVEVYAHICNNSRTAEDVTIDLSDDQRKMHILISREANIIAQRTRRGAANWLLVSPAVLAVMNSCPGAFSRESTNDDPVDIANGGFVYCGKWFNYKVYCNAYLDDAAPIMMGYKGASEVDAGLFWSSYVPMYSTGVVMDPNTGELCESYIQRAGITALEVSDECLAIASDYYVSIPVTDSNAPKELDSAAVEALKVQEAVEALQAEDAIDPVLAKMLTATTADDPKPVKTKKKRKNKKRK